MIAIPNPLKKLLIIKKMIDLDNYLIQYNKLPFEDIQIRYRRKRVLELLKEIKPSNILEIGCGYLPLFCDFKKFRKISIIEPVKTFYENAKEKSKGDPRIKIYNKLLENSLNDLRGSNFDFIIASSLLHEVGNPIRILNDIKEISNFNTRICIIVPNSHSFHRLLAVAMGLIKNEYEKSNTQKKMQQATTFDKKTLCKLLKDNGLNPYSSETYFVKPLTHEQMQKGLDKKIFNEEILDGLYKLSKTLPDIGSELMVLARKT